MENFKEETLARRFLIICRKFWLPFLISAIFHVIILHYCLVDFF